MQNDGFKKIDSFEKDEELVLFYEDRGSSRPVLIRKKDVPAAIYNHLYGDAIITTMLDQFICDSFGCFINRISPGYEWVREELAAMQMSGAEGVVVEYSELE